MGKDQKEQAVEEQAEVVQEGVHNYSQEKDYVWPQDEKVLEKLEWFQDQKLALMMHWGPYSQLGLVESWALSDADAEWSRRGIDWDVSGEQFKQQYFDLNKTFNPVRFQPEKWAEIAHNAGMKYLIFTTKHHDGFCMWDTKFSDYRITAESCPFHTHRYADICGHLFEAFRRKGFGIATYFSKADWHVDSYWSTDHERGSYQSRNCSYDPLEKPEIWEQFVQFTHNQILELAREYGHIDIMWFDAGWVAAYNKQDIRLGEVIEKIRKFQPGLLSADRTIGGPYENYVTPEQTVPEQPLRIPWESCITLGRGFSYSYDDDYKKPKEVIHLLVHIVAKGGNLALNVAPQPDGRLPQGALSTLEQLGAWLNIYGEAIYGTRVCAPYQSGDFSFTQKESEGKVFAIWLGNSNEETQELRIPYEGSVRKITCMEGGSVLPYKKKSGGYLISLKKPNETISQYGRVFILE